MKRCIALLALFCGMVPNTSSAGCRVACRQAVVVQDAVVVAAAVPVGIATYAAPVAAYSPYQYSWQGQPNVTVNVHIDAATLKAALQESATVTAEQPRPTLAAPAPPALTAVQQNCAKCHTGGNATATAKLDLRQSLTCEQKLAACRAVLAERMPKGGKLTPDEAGNVLTELTK